MSRQVTHELAIGFGLASLTKKLGARGAWIQHGLSLIDANLPFGELNTLKLTHITHDLARQYKKVGRKMDATFFGFENQFLLIITKGDIFMGLLFSNATEESGEIISTAQKYINMNQRKILEDIKAEDLSRTEKVTLQAPFNIWPTVEGNLRDILSQALSPTRAESIIAHSLLEYPQPENPKATEAVELATHIINHIPSRKKRRLILEEFQAMLVEEQIMSL